MLAATGSTMTQAMVSSRVGTWLYGTTTVSATAPAGTPAEPGTTAVEAAWVASSMRATALPASARRLSLWPW